MIMTVTVMLGDATLAVNTNSNNRDIHYALVEVSGPVLNISHRLIHIFTAQPYNSHSIFTSILQVRKLRHREVK